MFDRQEVLQIISDLSKDAFGSRIRADYAAMSDAELERTYNYYMDAAERSIREEEEAQDLMLNKWANHITRLMTENGIDNATAIRWDLDAMDCDGDLDYYGYKWNLPFSVVQGLIELMKGI